jgi:hypothetical protein
MPNLYNLTAQLHQTIQTKAKEFGIEIEIKSEYLILSDGRFTSNDQKKHYHNHLLQIKQIVPAIQAPQIRQILSVFKDVLGKNAKYSKYILKINEAINFDKGFCLNYKECLNPPAETKAEALCQKWLDGLEPLFDREPETVLTELLETLKTL